MASPLQRELLVVTGKGGVGKTTVASAIGLLASDRGLRTIVVEVGEQARLPALFDTPMPEAGVEVELQPGLWSLTIDPDRALLEWLQALGGRVSGRVLASSNTFQYFAAAAPGAKELISMVKIWELTRGNRWRGRERGRQRGYDLVVLDAPATGHALGMLGSPSTFGRIARVGPIASQAERLRGLLEDPARSSYFAVAQATEMAISETLDLQERLRERLGRELDAVVVNGVLPQRFSNGELRALAPLRDRTGGPGTAKSTVRRSALLAARAVSERARFQRNQLARLRRRSFAVIAVPFQFTAELDLASVQRIAAHLGRTI
ncbi:MAG TPA: ArsA family ATPase [Solirubrobacteraceae bacterium]|jgi:anion-transporting  ArsA/GET3 family ATPase